MARITLTNESTGRGIELTPTQFSHLEQALLDALDYRDNDLEDAHASGNDDDVIEGIESSIAHYRQLHGKLSYLQNGVLN